MKSLAPLWVLLSLALCLTSGEWMRIPSLYAAGSGDVQVINVTAKKYEFSPDTIRVKQGTKVQLKITAADHAHGFRISEVAESGGNGKPGLVFTTPQDCTKIEEGKTETVEFIAQAPGTYPFRCCVHCGCHHRAMKGAVVVEP